MINYIILFQKFHNALYQLYLSHFSQPELIQINIVLKDILISTSQHFPEDKYLKKCWPY